MMNYRKMKWLAVCLCFLMALGGCGAGEGGNSDDTPTKPQLQGYKITIRNEGGTPLELITVEVYSDYTKSAIVYQRITNSSGEISFMGRPEYVVVLQNVPAGYQAKDHYELTDANTTITLCAGAPLTGEHLDTKALFGLGDAMPDFTVTTSDGGQFTLSQALKDHDAVILNFWYMNCQPCKMEFPHLQEAYEQFDNVAVIALNPMDSDNASIEAFRQQNGYTFLMAKCDSRWGEMMNVSAYPVTMVIDRYGNISLIHNGSVDDPQLFVNMFGFFGAADYEQVFLRSHSQLPEYQS